MRTLWIVSYAVSLAACGGGQSGPQATNVGYLKGPSVKGLRYQAGDAKPSTETLPTTDAAGRYDISAVTIRFYVGALDLGSAPIGEVITLSQLGGTETALANKAMLLVASDEDGNPANGISISPELTARGMSWNVNPDSPTFVSYFETIIVPNIESVYGRKVTIPTPQQALATVTGAYRCTFAGMYSGNWRQPQPNLEDQFPPGYLPPSGIAPFGGALLTLVTTPGGRVIGHRQFESTIPVSVLESTTDLPMQTRPGFAWDLGHTFFAGNFPTLQKMDGVVIAESLPTGTMDGNRIAGAASAVQRFSTAFAAGDARYLLLIEMDVNARPSATVIVNESPPVSLHGSVSGEQLELSSASGNYRFDGPLRPGTNVLPGTWTDSVRSTSRTFSSTDAIIGCHT